MEKLLTISRLAAETLVPPSTIRLWTEAGFVDCVRSSSGQRLFREEAVRQVLERRARRQGAGGSDSN